MHRYDAMAIFGALGLLAILTVLETAAFPFWFPPLAAQLLPPVCLFPALRCALRRRAQLRLATKRHQAEQRRLMLACKMIHARADALATERRELLAQVNQLQLQCDALRESAASRQRIYAHAPANRDIS